MLKQARYSKSDSEKQNPSLDEPKVLQSFKSLTESNIKIVQKSTDKIKSASEVIQPINLREKFTEKKLSDPKVKPKKQSTEVSQSETELKIIKQSNEFPQTDIEARKQSKVSYSSKRFSEIGEPPSPIRRESRKSGICCTCGCTVDGCVCAEMEKYIDVLKSSTMELIKMNERETVEPCGPCDCGKICVCNDNICSCGCKLEDCICKNLGVCECGCGVDNCICEKLEAEKKCTCECGLDECICQQLFTKRCKCGHSDCSCDMVEILTTYLETLETTPKAKLEDNKLKFTNEESQTDGHTWLLETTQQQGSYCLICGHFNCCCTIKN